MPISFGQIYPALAKLEKKIGAADQHRAAGAVFAISLLAREEALRSWLFSERSENHRE